MDHVLQCSASPPRPASTIHTTTTGNDDDFESLDERKPPAKRLKRDDGKCFTIDFESTNATSSTSTKNAATPSLTEDDSSSNSFAASKDGPCSISGPTKISFCVTGKESSGVDILRAASSARKPSMARKKIKGKKKRTGRKQNAKAIVTTKNESSTLAVPSLSSNHILNQTWWREKTVRKRSSVTVPFSLESCFTTVKDSAGSPGAAATQNHSRELRTSTRRKNESLEMRCPICQRQFSHLLSVSLRV